MRSGFRTVLALTFALALAAAASAHHSVAGQFDTTKMVTLSGVITKIDWLNPHIYVFLDAKEEGGAVSAWALETLPTAMMKKAGLTKTDVAGKSGEVVTVTARPARDGHKSAWILKITYPDGHFYQLAN